MSQNPFEIPQQMRELAEKNVVQGRAAYDQFIDAMSQTMSTWLRAIPSNQMTSGFIVVQDRATKFAKQNADATFGLASDLAHARDLQEVFDLQSRFAKAQLQAYAFQAQELGRLTAQAAQRAQSRN